MVILSFDIVCKTSNALPCGRAFLGVLASLVCFVVWNIVLKQLGTIQSSNYLYLNPLFTTVAASMFLDEKLTVYAIGGVVLVLLGVFFSTKK